MWNRLAPYALKLLDMWNCLALYVLRLLGRQDPSPGLENEASDNIDLCYQMVNKEDDSRTATGGNYDVFLSFRGPDTRDGFTDCLYEFMHRARIRVYRDNEELPRGEQISKILQAVESSQILIPIFSKDYASSKWCLEELAYIVESTRHSQDKTILPIFYDVDPLDVTLRTNLYKSALEKHEKRYGCAQVKPWKEALKTVATIRGWHLKDMRHGKAMADITEEVLQKITTRKRNLPINLVGIDDRIEDIEKLLDCWDTSDVRFVIIYGIGGVGKTTLANAVFNQISSQFEGHSFLSNIQESSSYSGVEKMQRKLVADLFSYSFPETFDFDNGNNIIRERLPNKRVLLVFDGMDKKDKFMQLAEHCTLCHPGSRVIITTRDKSVFPMTKVEKLKENIPTGSRNFFLYEMKEMHIDHALQLFNKLAYNADSAPSDLHDLSREVVELAGGLPLVIEVMGSDLGSRRKVDQRSTLESFKEVSHEDVLQKLKISYDALDCWAQHIYLDIACNFANKKITNLMYMWKDIGFSPKDKIEVLVNKSLIKIVNHDRIWMHDQLIALGREIFRRENIRNLGDQNRLWCPEKASDMVHYKKGTENVVALALWRSQNNFTREHFVNLTNTRVLELDGGNFVGNFENVLPELRWLCWRNCPLQPEADNFLLRHLIILKLSGDITREHWSGWVKIMVASKLKVLRLAGSKSLMKTPCFSKLISLERLILKNFQNLAEIDHSIGELEQLVYLKIKWCPSLKELPVEIGCLTSLRDLILIQVSSLTYLPDSISNLRLLSRLVMEDSGESKLPCMMGGLVSFEHLYMAKGRRKLKSLVESILSGKLKSQAELESELESVLYGVESLESVMSELESVLSEFQSVLSGFESFLSGLESVRSGKLESLVELPLSGKLESQAELESVLSGKLESLVESPLSGKLESQAELESVLSGKLESLVESPLSGKLESQAELESVLFGKLESLVESPLSGKLESQAELKSVLSGKLESLVESPLSGKLESQAELESELESVLSGKLELLVELPLSGKLESQAELESELESVLSGKLELVLSGKLESQAELESELESVLSGKLELVLSGKLESLVESPLSGKLKSQAELESLVESTLKDLKLRAHKQVGKIWYRLYLGS